MEIPGSLPFILEDWELYLAEISKGESGETPDFFLHLQVTDWPYEAEKFFAMSEQRRPYPHLHGRTEPPTESMRKLWALNGMRSALAAQLVTLIESYCLKTGQLPLPGDEFIVKASVPNNDQLDWRGHYVVTKRLIMPPYQRPQDYVYLFLKELDWDANGLP
ncbi:MAG: hypothetical protein EOO61_19440 [Hymenobacter sp.]|nr:MAG: hypothetical protein EOO61_19440 [Hymenobacter sp.]